MHKRLLSSILLISFLALFQGCADVSQKKDVVAYVGDYETTIDDFNAYREKALSISAPLTLRQKTKLLDDLIDKQLLIQAAVEKGIDKEIEFMKEIEAYWHQALIKRILDKKGKEIASKVEVYKREKERYYRDVIGKNLSASILFLQDKNAADSISNFNSEEELRSYIQSEPRALLDFRQGYMQPRDLPFSFVQEIYSKQAGEFTGPVKIADNLWMVGYLQEKISVGVVPEFSEVEGQIQDAIRRQKELEGIQAWFRELKNNQKIVVNEDILSKIK